MNKLKNLGCLLLLLLVAHGARAQAVYPWSCSAEGWQYDMTVFAVVTYNNGSPVADQSNYEIAAFVGDECRGVADGANEEDLWTVGSNKVFYLRVRSNTASGENVTFQVYDKTEHSPISGLTFETVTFTNDAKVGEASSPFVLKRNVDAPYVLGDVNGDGFIDVADISAVTNDILGKANTVFIREAADMNSDGFIDVSDISAITNIILGK